MTVGTVTTMWTILDTRLSDRKETGLIQLGLEERWVEGDGPIQDGIHLITLRIGPGSPSDLHSDLHLFRSNF